MDVRCLLPPNGVKEEESALVSIKEEKIQFVVKFEQIKQMICDQCSKPFPDNSSLNMHMRVHTMEKPFHCTKCPAKFAQKGNLKTHVERIHTGKCNKPFICDQCSKSFGLRKTLKHHMKIHVKERLGEESGDKLHLTDIIDSLNLTKSHAPKGNYPCDVCGKVFVQQCQLNSHKFLHNEAKPFVCSVCGSSFKWPCNLKNHIRFTHNKEKPKTCPICGKKYSKKSLLTLHLRNHTGEKPYHCNQCLKGFSRTDILRKHLKKHELDVVDHTDGFTLAGFKSEFALDPFKCSDSKEFTSQSQDSIGTKAFNCIYCNKTFTRKDNLNKHLKAIHPVDGNIKSSANAPTEDKSAIQLKQGLASKIGQGKKSFSCFHCNKLFSWKHHMIRHLKNVHKNVYVPSSFGDSSSNELLKESKNSDNSFGGDMDSEESGMKRETSPVHIQNPSVENIKSSAIAPDANESAVQPKQGILSKINQGKKSFSCSQCNKLFSLKHHMVRHLKNFHKLEYIPSLFSDNLLHELVKSNGSDDSFGGGLVNYEKSGMKREKRCLNTKNLVVENVNSTAIAPGKESAFQPKKSLISNIEPGEKSFSCSQCNKLFSWKHHMVRHLKNVHKIEYVPSLFIDSRSNELIKRNDSEDSFGGDTEDGEESGMGIDKKCVDTKNDCTYLVGIENRTQEHKRKHLNDETYSDGDLKNVCTSEETICESDKQNRDEKDTSIVEDVIVDIPKTFEIKKKKTNKNSKNSTEASDKRKTREYSIGVKEEVGDSTVFQTPCNSGNTSLLDPSDPSSTVKEEVINPLRRSKSIQEDVAVPEDCEEGSHKSELEDSTTSIKADNSSGETTEDEGFVQPMPEKKKRKNAKRIHTCDVCSKEFPILSRLKKHALVHERNEDEGAKEDIKRASCDQCHSRFVTILWLKYHMRRLHPDDDACVSCLQCNIQFPSYRKLTEHHKSAHFDEKPYECKVCNRRFRHKSSLSTHKSVHTGELPYECKECKMRFRLSESLVSHTRKHTGEKPFTCDQCGKQFAHFCNWRNHMRVHTGEKPYTCSECNKAFARSTHLKFHMATHTGEKPYMCSECSKCFTFMHRLKDHMLTHNSSRCSICDEKCSNQKELKSHLKIHGNPFGNPFLCPLCKRDFISLIQLKVHVKTHDSARRTVHRKREKEEKRHVCNVCDKEYAQKHTLKYHIETVHNSGSKRCYHCGHCSKIFSQSSGLRYHMIRNHMEVSGMDELTRRIYEMPPSAPDTSGKPHSCDECGKTYSTRYVLQVHMLDHLGSKPFSCPSCDKCFTTAQKLHDHSVVHSESRPYKCDKCDSSFKVKDHLNKHVRAIHLGEKFTCEICKTIFARKSDLTRHLWRIHGKKFGAPLPFPRVEDNFMRA